MEKSRQNYDDEAWDRNDDASEASQKQLRRRSTCRLVEHFAETKFGQRATLVPPLILGGNNVIYRTSLEGASSNVAVRLPCPNLAQFPVEKTLQEAATAACIGRKTRVPVPDVFYYGNDSEVGPFLMMQYVPHQRDMCDALAIPDQDPSETPVLNPDIPESTLSQLYQKMASCLLQLSQLEFPRIGSLAEVAQDSFLVAQRPITQNMNNMVQLANIPRAALPNEDKTYGTADEWYNALAEMHIAQLLFQHNDLVSSEDDCRNKYVARQIFRRLAKEGGLSCFGFAEDKWSAQSKTMPSSCSAPRGSGSFRLWCDDFRPVNVLLDEHDDPVAVVDWEFTYAAPTQFILDPPWWLLLEVPEMWSAGIDDWQRTYESRLKTWLSAVEAAEKAIQPGLLPFDFATYMRESWILGRFWLSYAARKSWAFDTIFWKYLDERFFGPREDVPKECLWKTRVHLLTEEERNAMEPFVQRKMQECMERTLVDWTTPEVLARLSEVLFD